MAARTNKNLKRSFDAIAKWKGIKSESNKTYKKLKAKIRAAETQMYDTIESFEYKLQNRFDRKWGSTKANMHSQRKSYKEARGRIRGIETRLARKFALNAE